jgi:hypothetical protein
VIDVRLPSTITLKVAQTDPNVKGNSSGGVTKPATLETGAVVTVPGFIEEGEMIRINTDTDEYLGVSPNKPHLHHTHTFFFPPRTGRQTNGGTRAVGRALFPRFPFVVRN